MAKKICKKHWEEVMSWADQTPLPSENRETCKCCKGPIFVANPTGWCCHIYYPEYCMGKCQPSKKQEVKGKTFEEVQAILFKDPEYQKAWNNEVRTQTIDEVIEKVEEIDETMLLLYRRKVFSILEDMKNK